MNTFYVCPNATADNEAFATIAEAIAALPSTDETWTIRIAPGLYREKLTLTRPHTILEGTGQDPQETVLVYGDYARDLMPDGSLRRTFRTYTLLLDASHVTLRNLTISNDSGDETTHGQAIALYAEGDQILVENCRLLGRQDTLFTGPLPPKEIEPGGFIGPKQFAPRIDGHQEYRSCYICGNVDFIFGSATADFDSCTIESLSHGSPDKGQGNATVPSTPEGQVQGYVTAPSTPEGQAQGYIFRRCSFISSECPKDSVYLGRPWRDYAAASFIDCTMGPHICEEGFHDWDKPHAREVSRFSTVSCSRSDGSPYTARADFAR